MSIDFNRSRFQTKFEELVGINDISELQLKKNEFEAYILTYSDIQILNQELREDAKDYFFTGLISFSEGIDSIYEGRFSWATVKLYYSIFYLVRATMASKGIGLLRNKSMYRIKLDVGQKVFKTGNKRYNTTHEGTMSHYKDLFSYSDILLTNHVDDKDVYEWMQNAREITNYRESSFLEPDYLDIWEKYAEAIQEGTINNLLSIIEKDDTYMYCFQEEYAVVGIPFKRLLHTIEDLQRVGILDDSLIRRVQYSKDILKYDERHLTILSDLYE